MDELIKRSDAIKAIWGDDINPSEDGMVFEAQSHIDRDIRLIPSADIPQSDDWEKYSDKLWKKAYERGKADRPSAVDLSSVYSTAYKSGYEKGKADRPQGEWIDCEEPPSTDRNVFIAYGTDDMKSVCIGHYEHDMKLWYEDKNFFAKPKFDAMYWCEIPQFPTRMKGADDE